MLSMAACTDDLVVNEGSSPSADNKGTGELILFTAGRTSNLISTRADGDDGGDNNYTETPGETYYMGHSSRFVCRMYYIADNASETDFDLTDQNKTISWFVVDGKVGNSLYWNRGYNNVVLSTNTDVDKNSEENKSKYDTYGNDKSATFFYWQNRKNHAFLAWTDLNKAKNEDFKYGRNQGDLKLEPEDMTYQEHTDQKRVQNVLSGFRIDGADPKFDHIDDTFVNYIKEHYDALSGNASQAAEYNAETKGYDPNRIDWYVKPVNNVRYSYSIGDRHGETYAAGKEETEENIESYWRGPLLLWIWGDGQEQEYTRQTDDVVDSQADAEGKYWVKNAKGEKVALRIKVYVEEGTQGAEQESIPNPDDPENPTIKYFIYKYLATFASGKFHYDFTQTPQYCVAIHKYYEVKETDVINEYKVNKFDLTHKEGDGKTSIASQPDPCLALTIMKPAGATQAANRVNLYFKHQFSQVQVNLKSSSDNSVDITAGQIKKVELLGVSEEGYVFNELSYKLGADNKPEYYVHPATYKDVDVSDYEEAQLAINPYGTSLELFDMGADNYATGYLKSFNAITFGLLKAIRITWEETEANGKQSHVATFKVTDTNLSTLKSGRKYIWNIEIRRGTLAVITTTINDWIVPTDNSENGDNNLNYDADGTIKN